MKGITWATVLILALGLLSACKAGPAPTPTPEAEVPSTLPPSASRIKVIFHPDFYQVYSQEPAAEPGRMEAIVKELEGFYEFIKPEPAGEEDLRRVHAQQLIDSVKLNQQVYEVARLSAGGAILSAELAVEGEVTFGLLRPPGHHAGPDRYWGYCYFDNIAVAVKKLLDEKKIERALIVDFDLHFGDGTATIFSNDSRVTYYHLGEALRIQQLEALTGNEEELLFYTPKEGRIQQLELLEELLKRTTGYDILAVSAGFDGGEKDWGGIFEIEDYKTIGKLLKEASLRNCQGKRFAVLEGGYNPKVLGKNVKAFLEGFE